MSHVSNVHRDDINYVKSSAVDRVNNMLHVSVDYNIVHRVTFCSES